MPALRGRWDSAKPTILVTDAGLGSAITIIRCLGRQGWRVIAADSDARSLGFLSRYAHERFVYPAPEGASQAFVEALKGAARAYQADLIIPVTDAAILPLAQARDEFAGVSQLALPDTRALEVVLDKRQTLALAERLHVPTPQTCLVASVQEAVAAAQRLRWPVVLKPPASRRYEPGQAIQSFTVSYAADLSQLTAQMRRLEGHGAVLLQEFYPGEGQGVELLLHQGRPLLAFQHRRLREVPVTGGASAFREGIPLDPVLYRFAVDLMAALEWTGLAMVEFKLGAAGPKLMEINGRVWGSLPLAVLSGVDFPARLVELCLFGPPQTAGLPIGKYKTGVRSRNLDLEILWIASVLRGKRRYAGVPWPGRHQGLVALLQLVHPAYKFDLLARDDPRPGVAELAKIARKLCMKLHSASAADAVAAATA